jgi:hypothetical protein
MTKQSFGRSVPVVSRDTSAVERTTSADPSWYSGFVAALDKQSVKSRQQDYSLFEQISSMMTHKSKYSTVDEAVDDFKKRTGLDKYLISLAQQSPIIDNETPISQQTQDLFQQVPGLKEYIQNYIDVHPGTSVEAVSHDILKIRSVKEALPQSTSLPESIKKFINEKIALKQKEGDQQSDWLGGTPDLSYDENTDIDNPLSALEPTGEH